MNVEQRLMQAFDAADRVEPSTDLWARVVHSIEEDREHRRRVVRTAVAVVAALTALVAAGALAMQDSPGTRQGFVHRSTMELLETIGLLAVLFALGPAIRRFGRGYANDLWPSESTTPAALLRLMDVAFYLVGIGYILLSAKFDFATTLTSDRLAGQLTEASIRAGGLLLALGVLHAQTLFALPMIALIDNSTRASKRLPRWLILMLIVTALSVVPVIQATVLIGVSDW
jgi:hypothetical protein